MIVIIMYGYPTTGKTFMSNKLKEAFQERYKVKNISTLNIRKKFNLFDLKSESQRNLSYNLIAEEIDKTITVGKHDIAIIDGNFNKRSRREKIYSSLKNSKVYIIHCMVSNEDIINQRIIERQKNSFVFENRAASMELYNLIKHSGDNIYEDSFILEKGMLAGII